MINGECVLHRPHCYLLSNWSALFVAVPRVGEYVEDGDGVRHRVLSVTHAMHEGKPFIKVDLGSSTDD